jgi:succinate dehydrogenase / fumarate reductase cytochrome b subunit
VFLFDILRFSLGEDIMSSTTRDVHSRRPLSPHLTIYKKQISSVLSIFHRLTGIGVFIGFSVATWWMVFWIFSKFDPYIYNMADNCVVRVGLYALSMGLFYHLCNGIRHLFWDMGYGYSLPVMRTSGWAVLIISILLTILFWVVIC